MSQPHRFKRSPQTLYFDALTNLNPLTISGTIHTLCRILHDSPRFESEYPEISSARQAPIPPATQISTFYTTIALLRSYLGEYWLAKHTFLKAIAYNPSSTLAHFCLGICLFELGDYMHAEREFGRCLGEIGEEEGVDLSFGCRGEDREGKIKGKWRLKKLDVAWNMLASHNTFEIRTYLLPEERPWGIVGVPATFIFSNSPLTEEALQRLLPVSRTKPLPPLPPLTPFAKTPIEEGTTDDGKDGNWSSSSHAPSSPPNVLTRVISPSFTEIRAGPPDTIDPKFEEGKIQDEKETNDGTRYEDEEGDEEPPPSSLQPNQNRVYSDPLRGTQPPQEESEEYDPYYDLEFPLLLHSGPASPSGSFSSLISLYAHSPSSDPIPSSTFTQTPPSTNPLPSSTFTQTPPTTTSINRHPDFPTGTAEEETSTPTQASKEEDPKPALTIPFPSTSSTTPINPTASPAPLPTALPPTGKKPMLALSTAAAAPFRPVPAYKLMAQDMSFLPLSRTYGEIRLQAEEAERAVQASMRGLGISGVPVDPALYGGKRDGKGLGDGGAEILLPRTFEGFGPRKKRGGE